MAKTYTPATFQPTVRPSWAGILSYISEKERSEILEAIIRFPEKTNIQSKFWEETAKPDLESQYQKFVQTCEARGKGPRTYWGEHKLYLSNTNDKEEYNFLKDKDKDKDKGEDKSQDKDKSNTPIYNNINNKGEDIDYEKRKALADKIGTLIKRVPTNQYDFK